MAQVQAGTPSARRIEVDRDTMEVLWQDDHLWTGDDARQIWSERVTVTGNLGYGQWSCVITLPYGSMYFYDQGRDEPEIDEEFTVDVGTLILAQARNATREMPQGAHDNTLYVQVLDHFERTFRFRHTDGNGKVHYSNVYVASDILLAYAISDTLYGVALTRDEVKAIKRLTLKHLGARKA